MLVLAQDLISESRAKGLNFLELLALVSVFICKVCCHRLAVKLIQID
jgi:hypothetical protein